ncbi:MAG: hypothetical protein OEX19_15735 [Gammaproteobacteria bacterium]|nr:hypothetical protein [Gammaproteobacteria bacterium]
MIRDQKIFLYISKAAVAIAFMFPMLVSANSCFDAIDYIKPKDTTPDRALYVFVDQTTPLNKEMRQKVSRLLEGWGKPGDLVKVAQFSANMEGRYPEVVFNQQADVVPDEKYLFQLRWNDRKEMMACLENQKEPFKMAVKAAVDGSLKAISSKIPKTELLFSLKELSKQIVIKDEAKHQVVVLISNGMENSSYMSFYGGKTMKKLPTQKTISTVRRKGLIGHWRGADVYIYGLGVLENKKAYVKAEQLKELRAFWERYFVEGGGKIKAVGMPELLVSAID